MITFELIVEAMALVIGIGAPFYILGAMHGADNPEFAEWLREPIELKWPGKTKDSK